MKEKKRILVIVDDSSIVEIIEEVLKEEYSILTVKSGQDSLVSIQKYKPDLILLDNDMYEYDAFTWLKQAKQYISDKNIPLIILIANISEETLAAFLEYGIVDFIRKPVYKNLAQIRINNALRLNNRQETEEINNKPSDGVEIAKLKQTEKAFQKSDLKLQSFIDSATIGISLWNSGLNLIDINQAALKFLPFEVEKMSIINKNILEIYPALKETENYDQYLTVLKTGKSVTFNELILNKNLEEIFLSVKAFKAGDDLGVLLMDITDLKRTAAALKESETRFKEAQKIANLGSWNWYLNDNKLTWNDHCYQQYGYEPGEIKITFDVFRNHVHPDDLQAVLDSITQSLEKDEPYSTDFRIIQKNGEVRNVHVEGIIDRDNVGRPVRFVGTQQDITSRKQTELKLRDSEERFLMAMSAAEMGSWKWNKETNMDTRDANFNRILGLEEIESTQPVEDFISRVHPEDRPFVEKELERSINNHDVYLVEFRIVTPDGTVKWLRDRGLPYYNDDNKLSYMIGAVVDITLRKQAEKELQEEKDRAQAAQKEAEQANNSKSEFLSNVSHELRNPMHAILSFANFGVQKTEKTEQEKVLHYFKQIQKSGNRLLFLLDDLLDLSKLEAGKMEYQMEEGDLLETATSMKVEFDAVLSEKNLKLNITKPPFPTRLNFDHNRISQVLRNLVSNAIKFSQNGAEITVHFEEAEKEKNGIKTPAIKTFVVDNGPGIPDDEMELIFDKFLQSSLTKKTSGGTGLGLAISRNIITAHGGEIWVEKNREGGGSIFVFLLPGI